MKPAISMAALILALSSAAVLAQAQETVSLNYIAAQEALAADDYAKAKTALTELSAESQGDVKTRAEAAAAAADITGMRKAFKPLSELIAQMRLPEGYAVAFCPMFEGGASWVQKRAKIANPYFGNAMLTCGEFR